MDAKADSASEAKSKARIFISYSRKDMAFADRLEAALKARGFEPLIDREEIYAFEDWWRRIEALIGDADTVVFVLSPDAVTSKIALKEVAHAASLNKRFAPIVCRHVHNAAVPEALQRLNFIFFDDPAHFEASADALAEALQTDIDWIRQHTEFGELARRWSGAGRPGGLLLRSPVLEEAERWIASRPKGAPAPTEETQTFIRRSRQAATRRRNFLTGSLAAGLVLAIALSGLAYWQRGLAVEQRNVAQRNEAQAKAERDKALTTQSQFLADTSGQLLRSGDAATAALVAIEALPDSRGIERPYLPKAELALSNAQQGIKEVSILRGHSSEVYSATFSPDGNRIVTASDDRTARIWDAATGQTTSILQQHAAPVYSATFSPDGRYVATVGGDAAVYYWDSQTNELRGQLKITSKNPNPNRPIRVVSVAFSPDGRRVLASIEEGTALLAEFESGKMLREFRGRALGASAGAFSPDGQRIVTAFGKTVQIYDINTGKVLMSFDAGESLVSSAAFSPDGERLVTAAGTSAVIRDSASGTNLATLEGHTDTVKMAVFSADGRQVLTASEDGTARIWNTSTGKAEFIISGQSPNGIGIPDYASDKYPFRPMGFAATYSAAFSPDGKRVVIASWDQTARVFDLAKQADVTVIPGNPQYAVLSPDGRHAAINAQDNQVSIWDIEKSELMTTLAVPGAGRPGFSPDGRRLLTFEYTAKTARIWDLATKEMLMAITDPSAQKGAFSPDGHRILTFASAAVRIWDAENGKLLMTFDSPGDTFNASFSKDGQRIVTAGHFDNTAIVWDARTGESLQVLHHGERVLSAEFSADDQKIVTSSRDAKAHIWDSYSGKELTSFSVLGVGLASAVFSPDGQRIATAGGGDVGIWDAKTGRATRTLAAHAAILEVEFSPDGRRIMAALGGKETRIWPLPGLQELIDQTRQAIQRCLTPNERRTAFLDPEPPSWCIDMEKWPYQTREWKDWLSYKRAGTNPPLPDTPEWNSWILAHQ
jgi:WD40 repeat protein